MSFLYIFLILIIIFGVLGIVYVSYYNKMQFLRTKIEQSEGIIDETLRERYDILTRASEIVTSAIKSEKDYFKDYLNTKSDEVSNFEMDRNLKNAFHVLNSLINDFPELQKNKKLKEILISIKATNERIVATTSYYNKNTNELNGYVRKFPSNIVGKFHRFKVKPFFDGKDMTDDNTKDFKI